jgi:hypothetical protein
MRDFALEVYFSKWEFAARYNLAGSDGENMTLAQLLSLATPQDRAAFDGVGLGYTETFGAPALSTCSASQAPKKRFTRPCTCCLTPPIMPSS